jgi:uncharacterized protein YndB with AHSA1/START domain
VSDVPPGVPVPDSANGTFGFVVEQTLAASASDIYQAWTERIDSWFAAPGAAAMTAEVGAPFWFETEFDGTRHPHYGRFTRLDPDRLIEMTWVTGRAGTDGAETLVTVELQTATDSTQVRLTHGGFYDGASAQQHLDAWPRVLEHLDEVLSRPS